MIRIRAMRALAAAGVAALLVVASADARAAEFRSRALPGFPGEQAAQGGAAAAFRGAIEIQWDRKAFGGFSALDADRDGARLVALSDRGAWLEFRLVYAGDRLVGADYAVLRRLRGPDGDKLKKSDGDAEALSPDGRGGFVVALEQPHRLWRYPQYRKPFFLPPEQLALPAEVASLPANHGLEALTRLCDGRYFLIAERSTDATGRAAAWIGGPAGWRPLAYVQGGGFSPSGAATLPDCSVVVVERATPSEGARAVRVVRIPEPALGPAETGPVRGRVLLGPLDTTAKFEGIAAARRPSGETYMFLVSDNDFAGRSILVAFALSGLAAPPGTP